MENIKKKNCVDIRNIKGNTSNKVIGAFNKVKKKGSKAFEFVSLKKDISSKIFKTIISKKKIDETKKNFFKKLVTMYL